MMRVEPCEEDPKISIVLGTGATTGEDKGKQPEEGEWVRKSPEKETGFDLEHAKETFMEVKKSFAKAFTSRSQEKPAKEMDPSMITMFLETCVKLLRNSKVVKGLKELINRCAREENATDGPCKVRNIFYHKTRMGCEMRLTT